MERFLMSREFVFTLLMFLVVITPGCAAAEEHAGIADTYHRVAYDNCGVEGKQPHVVQATNWTWSQNALPWDEVSADDPARTVSYRDNGPVVYKYNGLDPEAGYKLRIVYLSSETTGPRVQSVSANGNMLEERLELPLNEVIKKEYELDPDVYGDGVLELKFAIVSGVNPVVSSIELLSDSKTLLAYLDLKIDATTVGIVKGTVADSTTELADGVEVVLSLPERGLELVRTTNANGEFAANIPKEWQKYKNDKIKIAASKGKAKAAASVLIQSILPVEMPQLTPRPVSVGGLNLFKIDLNGTWKFDPTPEEGFQDPQVSVENWADIKVPGEWVMQGFDAPRDKGVGYRRTIAVPADWAGKRVKIRFDGVYCGSTLWVNGEEVGFHDGGFSPFEYDITEYVNPGKENVLALSVINDSPAGIMSNQSEYAAHPIGGITRKAMMFAVDELNVSRFHVETHFDDQYRDATLKILLNVSNEGGSSVYDAGVWLWMTGPDGNWVSLENGNVELPTIKADDKLEHVIEVPVKAPAKWDAEHPNLYNLYCVLRKGNKQVETVSRRIGFRQVEVRGSQIFVNNKPIKLRGICRHEAHPLMGRSLDPGANLWRKDAEIFRAANMNYIRTSHYPPAEEFIDACDELGLFVECEAPFCFTGLGAPGNPVHRSPPSTVDDPQYRAVHTQVTVEMIERDRSHPSIIIWSVGNESKWGANFIAAGKAAQKADPTRPWIMSAWGPGHDGGMLDLGGAHYPSILGPDSYSGHGRPVVVDEYSHLHCYNINEAENDPGLRDYWGMIHDAEWEGIYSAKSVVGGAIWSAIDGIFYLPTKMDGPFVGYGKWGPVDGWRREKPEYWNIKKSFSPVKIFKKTVEVPGQGEPLRIDVENRFIYSNLKEVKAFWSIGDESGTADIDIEPRSKGVLTIDPQRTDLKGKDLVLKFYHPTGYMIDAYKLSIGPKAALAQVKPSGKAKLAQDQQTITINGKDVQWVISKDTGMIQKGIAGGNTVILGGPVLMVTPGMSEVSDPLGPGKKFVALPKNVRCSNWKADKVSASQSGDQVVVEVTGRYDQAVGSYTMRFDGEGMLDVDYSFEYQTRVNPREIGIVFDVAKDCDTLNWKRKAFWTWYPADHIGRTEGTARAFRSGKYPQAKEHTSPPWPWYLDSNAQGTNDFRSTKYYIVEAGLKDADQSGVKVISDGHHSTRAFVENDHIGLLVAFQSVNGARYFDDNVNPPGVKKIHLSKGTKFEDSVKLLLGN